MAVTIVRGNVTPAPNTVTDLFTVPAGVFMGGTIVVKSRESVIRRYTISVAQGGVATNESQNVCKNRTVPAGKTVAYDIPTLLRGGDKVRVSTDGTAINFSIQQAVQVQ